MATGGGGGTRRVTAGMGGRFDTEGKGREG
jgi:hypothetical protein